MKKIEKITTMAYKYDHYDELLKHSWDMLGNKWDIDRVDEDTLTVYYSKDFLNINGK